LTEADLAFGEVGGASYVLYNGADQNRFYPANAKERLVPQIVFTGRLVAEKGVHVLLEAMRILKEHDVAAVCKVIGGAAFGSNRVTNYVSSLMKGIQGNVAFTGYMSGADLAEALRSSDIYCCPSVWEEPFGMAIVEAMASGLPVVASNIGGIPEILEHGGGILVPPNNSIFLAKTLEGLIADNKSRQRMAAESLGNFEKHFTWDVVRLQYSQILEEVSA
jgi:glycosyltransferase involved in cell wall biosynthesis